MQINLKSQNSDFVVNEIALPQIFKNGDVYIYSMQKSGCTTTEAIIKVAENFSCKLANIGYSGLKDEDGITVQLISLPILLNIEQIDKFHKEFPNIQLMYQGNAEKSLEIGALLGNTFTIIARNIDKDLAQKLLKIPRYSSIYINFYGLQRFGKPSKSKKTHLIGKALLNKQFQQAYQIMLEQNQQDIMLTEKYEEYFKMIDPRQVAFYLSSHYSYLWNIELQKKINHQHIMAEEFEYEKIPFSYIKSKLDKFKLFAVCAEQELIKYRVKNNSIIAINSIRQTCINTEIFISNIQDDELNHGKYRATLSLFLPTGSYATVIIPQFFYEIL